MPDFSEILEHVAAFADEPDALRDYLWRCKRVFGERFVATLDREHPWWRRVMGPRVALLGAARGGAVAFWIDVAALPFASGWSAPERERYVRWFSDAYGDSTRVARPPCPDPPAHEELVAALLNQWQSARRPKEGRWVVDAVFRLGESAARRGLVHQIWSDDALQVSTWRIDRPESWTLAQQVALMHDSVAARARARAALSDWATAHGRSLASFGDHVALYWGMGGDDGAFDRALQVRRLESAMVERLEWSWSELREVALQDHPVSRLLQEVVWWTHEGVACALDERAQPRDVEGAPVDARSLTLLHPALLAWEEIEPWFACPFGRVGRLEAEPIDQLGRLTSTLYDVTYDADHWMALREPAHLRTYMLMGTLRDRGWVVHVGWDNGVIPFFSRYHAASDSTALWKLERPLFSRSSPEERELDVRLVVLRGEWTSDDLNYTFYQHDYTNAPRWAPIQREHVLAPGQVDPVVLSEAVSDVRRVAR